MKIVALGFALLVAGACLAGEAIVTVRDTPANLPWWQRTSFHPVGGSIRGIPVQQIRSGWCAANELSLELFPAAARRDGEFPLDRAMRDAGLGFSITERFDGIERMTAVVGVYETCAKEQGTFLLMLVDRDGRSEVAALDIVYEREARFAALHPLGGGQIEVWSCFSCDVLVRYVWNESERRLIRQLPMQAQ